jgi:hypothetical protein
MNTTRRRILQTTAASGLAVLSGASGKRVLAILGDAYHCVAPLDAALVGRLRKSGYQAVTIMDYSVPWDDFPSYDLVILSREGREYINFYKGRDGDPPNKGQAYWLTTAQEQKFEDYVKAGGRLFFYHDGIGNYPRDGVIARIARAAFIRHPAIVSINVTLTGKMPELTQGVTPFTVADEEYQVEMDESQTAVFIESHSPEHGRAAQGWAHTYGKGKVAVFIPGHSAPVISHPMVQRSVQNIIDWLVK